MRKISLLLSILLIVAVDVSNAQLAKDSWAFGFGGTYPRFLSVNIQPLNSNIGGFLSLNRNFSEHVGLRFKTGYFHFEGKLDAATPDIMKEATNLIAGNLDLLYYLIPCEPVSPYLFAGAGIGLRILKYNYLTRYLDENETVLSFNLGIGVETALDSDWKIMAEYGYHITNNSEFDGAIGTGEINGRDSYMGISLGLLYFIDKGEPSKYCQLYSGITQENKDMTDYNKIESMIIKHIPKEVVKEVAVERPSKTTATAEKWVLIGVNFDFNKSKLLPESYPILYDAAKTLLRNPDMKVEIQGYTDNVGSESYNKKLGQKRADAVKEYLVSKGVAANRLSTTSFGEGNPVADNKTADGRAMNRRIEFKVQ